MHYSLPENAQTIDEPKSKANTSAVRSGMPYGSTIWLNHIAPAKRRHKVKHLNGQTNSLTRSAPGEGQIPTNRATPLKVVSPPTPSSGVARLG